MQTILCASRRGLAALVGLWAAIGGTSAIADDVAKAPKLRQQRRVTRLQTEVGLATRMTTPFVGPEELKPVNGVFSLTLGTSVFSQSDPHSVDGNVPRQFDLVCYKGAKNAVGPIIRVKRGATFETIWTSPPTPRPWPAAAPTPRSPTPTSSPPP